MIVAGTALRLRAAAVIGGMILVAASRVSAQVDPDALVHRAATTLRDALRGRSPIPPSVMRAARAIIVFPAGASATKMRGGYGIVSAKAPEPETWLLPAVVSIKATLRIPRRRVAGDVFVIAITRRGFDALAQDFLLPEGIVIPPGPMGRKSAIKLGVDLVAYARFKVALAGIAIESLEMTEEHDANTRLYGVESPLNNLMFGRIRTGPSTAMAWPDDIEAYLREQH